MTTITPDTLIHIARGFNFEPDGKGAEHNDEYLRGQIELIRDAAGLPGEDFISEWLGAQICEHDPHEPIPWREMDMLITYALTGKHHPTHDVVLGWQMGVIESRLHKRTHRMLTIDDWQRTFAETS